ncbi:MAG: ACP S-malonyltransferase [Eubacteriales bacterium]|nr:ACP S-malonyltransferase [Eubacteriales bacterium]
MGGVALVFAGQGAQYSGMGKSLYDNSAAARALFESAEAIYPGICDMCFNGSTEQLSVTINTQPALYVVDLACAAVLDEMDVRADMTAGFSLGELAANAYAGTFAFDEGLKLVGRRAEYMDSCASNNKGYMAAVLKLPNAKVEAIAAEFEHVYPANYNAAGQLTVACGVEEYDDFVRMIGESGGRTVTCGQRGVSQPLYDGGVGAF